MFNPKEGKMNWLNRVKDRLFPVSEEQTDVRTALEEWEYRGGMYDLEVPSEDCELCGKEEIRFQFEIVNRLNGNSLQIGSQCITRFGGISVIDESGAAVTAQAAIQKVARDRRKLIEDSHAREVMRCLIELAQVDEEFFEMIKKYEGRYQERGRFSPKELNLLVWRMKENNIAHNPISFKMSLKKNNEKDGLKSLKDWQVRQLIPYMNSSQREWARKNWGKN